MRTSQVLTYSLSHGNDRIAMTEFRLASRSPLAMNVCNLRCTLVDVGGMRFLLFVLLLCHQYRLADTVTCYTCNNNQDSRCRDGTCNYGLFGCIKIATFSGGVDRIGNVNNDPAHGIFTYKGCNVLPILGGVEACKQEVLIGFRVVTCYCFTDYCNGSNQRSVSFSLSILSTMITFFVVHYLL